MSPFFLAVIEGFYGRQWSWSDRRGYAQFLSAQGFDAYVYAPKGDSFLRSCWREAYPEEAWQQLLGLAAHYRRAGLRFGLGLSPLGLNHDYTNADRDALRVKVELINDLKLDILCILFDDARADVEGLAARQLSIVEDISNLSNASQIIVCPSYYSFDPVLEKVFGAMPANYLEDFGRGLDSACGIFWTGNKVVSSDYKIDDIERAAALLQRRPMLWDNYPVNDGRVTSNFLHLKAYSGRPWQLSTATAGHWVNPMNQAALSQIVLRTLGDVYRLKEAYDSPAALLQSVAQIGDPAFAEQLLGDLASFQERGLSGLGAQEIDRLRDIYRGFEHPLATEIQGWLAGGYIFDPACLTD